MSAALRRVGAVAGAVALGVALALAARPAVLTELVALLVDTAG